MRKITVKIDGMRCGMCEAHVCDTIRRTIPDAKKVTASRKRGEATFLSEAPVPEETLKKAISDTGYLCLSVSEAPRKSRGLFGR